LLQTLHAFTILCFFLDWWWRWWRSSVESLQEGVVWREGLSWYWLQ
jgi:hypothetical protein